MQHDNIKTGRGETMAEDKNSKVTQNQDRINKLIDGLTLFDDDLMSRVFDKNIEATELLLRIILERKIKVISVIGQEEMKSAAVGGRNITLDVHALDENGEKMDIEVQGNSEGAHIRRARYHSSVLDSRMLKEGQEFKEIKDSYVIFIYKRDKFQEGLPLYHIDRYVRETGKLFEDGSHIIYVNGNYKGDDEIGYLMQDFHQTDPDNMHYKVQEYAKEYANEYANEKQAANVKNLMESAGFTMERALDSLKIQGEEREAIIQLLQK